MGYTPALVEDRKHAAPNVKLVQLVIHIGFQVIMMDLSGSQALPKPTSWKCWVTELHHGRFKGYIFMKNDMWITDKRKKRGEGLIER
jgi:hypothetical protein